ncbi:hypothetical protein VNO77_44039 [Canavalia gladiata]|uniref:Uncharacterized protein n=1 Tax=Canavalia gladiata TaxID=3824 RepID=A0AAN9JXH4_CANGL
MFHGSRVEQTFSHYRRLDRGVIFAALNGTWGEETFLSRDLLTRARTWTLEIEEPATRLSICLGYCILQLIYILRGADPWRWPSTHYTFLRNKSTPIGMGRSSVLRAKFILDIGPLLATSSPGSGCNYVKNPPDGVFGKSRNSSQEAEFPRALGNFALEQSLILFGINVKNLLFFSQFLT